MCQSFTHTENTGTHGSFFKSQRLNNLVGKMLGIYVYVLHHSQTCTHRKANCARYNIYRYTPFQSWRSGHRVHHEISSNLHYKQDNGQTSSPWTVQDFKNASTLNRLWYLVAFGPLSYFTVVPFVNIVIIQRFYSSFEMNTCLAIWCFFVWWCDLVFLELVSVFIMCNIGYLLFHAQHTFQGAYKRRDLAFDDYQAAMLGSSFLKIPNLLKFFTLGIEYHHIHHLNTRVPCYRLQECHESGLNLFKEVRRISFCSLVCSLPLSLYDEGTREFRVVYSYLFTSSS